MCVVVILADTRVLRGSLVSPNGRIKVLLMASIVDSICIARAGRCTIIKLQLARLWSSIALPVVSVLLKWRVVFHGRIWNIFIIAEH